VFDGGLLLEGEETEAAGLLLLLVVHDDHLGDLAVASKEGAQIGLGDVRGQAAQEDLVAAALLRFLQGARIARLGVDGAAVERVRSVRQHVVDVGGIGKGHEAKAARPAALVVLHHHAVDDVPEAAEVARQVLLRRLPGQAAHKQFAPLILFHDVVLVVVVSYGAG